MQGLVSEHKWWHSRGARRNRKLRTFAFRPWTKRPSSIGAWGCCISPFIREFGQLCAWRRRRDSTGVSQSRSHGSNCAAVFDARWLNASSQGQTFHGWPFGLDHARNFDSVLVSKLWAWISRISSWSLTTEAAKMLDEYAPFVGVMKKFCQKMIFSVHESSSSNTKSIRWI